MLLYALAVVMVPVGVLMPGDPGASLETDPTETRVAEAERADLKALSGIWWRYELAEQGGRVRFYYFHGDGTGLYRYGRVGLTNTQSFDYDVRGDRLVLDFRKTGEHHEVPFALTQDPSAPERDWLELTDDPRESVTTRYFRESDETIRVDAQPATELGPAPAGHMWIDLRQFATGGQGFSMYQFRPAGIDGRGTGWFHRGDFDDWSTEWLNYRVVGDQLELQFPLAREDAATRFAVATDAEGQRTLSVADDPRDYWHSHRYVDMGPSFGTARAPMWLEGMLAPTDR